MADIENTVNVAIISILSLLPLVIHVVNVHKLDIPSVRMDEVKRNRSMKLYGGESMIGDAVRVDSERVASFAEVERRVWLPNTVQCPESECLVKPIFWYSSNGLYAWLLFAIVGGSVMSQRTRFKEFPGEMVGVLACIWWVRMTYIPTPDSYQSVSSDYALEGAAKSAIRPLAFIVLHIVEFFTGLDLNKEEERKAAAEALRGAGTETVNAVSRNDDTLIPFV